jgi:hypothetical protein
MFNVITETAKIIRTFFFNSNKIFLLNFFKEIINKSNITIREIKELIGKKKFIKNIIIPKKKREESKLKRI